MSVKIYIDIDWFWFHRAELLIHLMFNLPCHFWQKLEIEKKKYKATKTTTTAMAPIATISIGTIICS